MGLLAANVHMRRTWGRARVLSCQSTGMNPRNRRDDFSRPALTLNSLFLEALSISEKLLPVTDSPFGTAARMRELRQCKS